MCSHDWAKKFIAGNLNNQKIIDVWLNQKYEFARKNFYQQIEIFLLVINAMFQVNLLEISMQESGKNYMKKWLNKIDRLAQDSLDRSKYLRLDKNEE